MMILAVPNAMKQWLKLQDAPGARHVKSFVATIADAICRPDFTPAELAACETGDTGLQFHMRHALDLTMSEDARPDYKAARQIVEVLSTGKFQKDPEVKSFIENIALSCRDAHHGGPEAAFTAGCAFNALAHIDPRGAPVNNEKYIAWGSAAMHNSPMVFKHECVPFTEEHIMKPRTIPPTQNDFYRLEEFHKAIKDPSLKTRSLFALAQMGINSPSIVSASFFQDFTLGNDNNTRARFAPVVTELEANRQYLIPREIKKLEQMRMVVGFAKAAIAPHTTPFIKVKAPSPTRERLGGKIKRWKTRLGRAIEIAKLKTQALGQKALRLRQSQPGI